MAVGTEEDVPADVISKKVQKVKERKASVDKREKNRGVPAGAQGGAMATASPDKVTSGLKSVVGKSKNIAPPAGQGSTRG